MLDKGSQPHLGKYSRLRSRGYPVLWFVAAVDENLILKCPVAEQDKQAGIGAAVLCTSAAAFVSGYFTFHSISAGWFLALPLAIFYSLIIFNLDRFMIGSMRKDRDGNKLKEFQVAVPRIILATVIAMLITKPVEVLVFGNQIEAARLEQVKKRTENLLESNKREQQKISDERVYLEKKLDGLEARKSNCDNSASYQEFKRMDEACRKSRAVLEASRDNVQSALNILYTSPRYHSVGEDGRKSLNSLGISKRDGYRAVLRDLSVRIGKLDCGRFTDSMDLACKEYIRGIKLDIDQQNKRKTETDNQLHAATIVIISEKAAADSLFRLASSDLLGKLDSLSEIKKNKSSIWWSSFMIGLFFFIIEIAPIAIKILSPRGKYDTMLYVTECEALDQEVIALAESTLSKEIRIKSIDVGKDGLIEAENEINRELYQKIIKEQALLTEKIVQAWRLQEEKSLKDNPAKYIDGKIRTE